MPPKAKEPVKEIPDDGTDTLIRTQLRSALLDAVLSISPSFDLELIDLIIDYDDYISGTYHIFGSGECQLDLPDINTVRGVLISQRSELRLTLQSAIKEIEEFKKNPDKDFPSYLRKDADPTIKDKQARRAANHAHALSTLKTFSTLFSHHLSRAADHSPAFSLRQLWTQTAYSKMQYEKLTAQDSIQLPLTCVHGIRLTWDLIQHHHVDIQLPIILIRRRTHGYDPKKWTMWQSLVDYLVPLLPSDEVSAAEKKHLPNSGASTPEQCIAYGQELVKAAVKCKANSRILEPYMIICNAKYVNESSNDRIRIATKTCTIECLVSDARMKLGPYMPHMPAGVP